MDANYLTVTENAVILKISRQQVQHMVDNGRILCNRYHRRVIINREDLESFMRRNSTSNINPHLPDDAGKTTRKRAITTHHKKRSLPYDK